MVRFVKYIMLSMIIILASCSKDYVEDYSSIYRTDKDGNKICRMFTSYDFGSSTATHAIVIYYSGKWEIDFVEPVDWAYVDRTAGEGVTFLHVGLLQNDGTERMAVLRLKCDNGETADITITQASK